MLICTRDGPFSAMIYDFHTHTFLSDGTLSPIELVRRALVADYRVIGLTDHVAAGHLSRLISEIKADCALARAHWDILALAGVELTHVPPKAIPELAQRAKDMGAELVIVHGETITEPVESGTNRQAVLSTHVDILAHPGLLTLEDAKLAAANGIFLEISARRGHSLANHHLVNIARQAGAKLLLNSDAHDSPDLLTPTSLLALARGAGLEEEEIKETLEFNPRALLKKLSL